MYIHPTSNFKQRNELNSKDLAITSLSNGGELRRNESGYNSQDLESPSNDNAQNDALNAQIESLKQKTVELTQELEKTVSSFFSYITNSVKPYLFSFNYVQGVFYIL